MFLKAPLLCVSETACQHGNVASHGLPGASQACPASSSGRPPGTSPSVPALPRCAESKPPGLTRPLRAPLARSPDGAAPFGLRRKPLLPDSLFKSWFPRLDHSATCQPGSCSSSSSVKSQLKCHFRREAVSSRAPRSDDARRRPLVVSFCPSLHPPPPPQPHHVRVREDDRHGTRPDRPGRPDLHEDLLRSHPAAARSR